MSSLAESLQVPSSETPLYFMYYIILAIISIIRTRELYALLRFITTGLTGSHFFDSCAHTRRIGRAHASPLPLSNSAKSLRLCINSSVVQQKGMLCDSV